jgi:hypothetical protein
VNESFINFDAFVDCFLSKLLIRNEASCTCIICILRDKKLKENVSND